MASFIAEVIKLKHNCYHLFEFVAICEERMGVNVRLKSPSLDGTFSITHACLKFAKSMRFGQYVTLNNFQR